MHLITGLGTGGAERMLTHLVTGSKNPDIRHVVVSMMGKDVFGKEIEQAGVELFTLNMSNKLSALKGLWHLHKIIKKIKPGTLQTWLYHADLMGSIYKKLFGFPGKLLWNIRCSNMDDARYNWLTKILTILSAIPNQVLVNSKSGLNHHKVLGYKPQNWAVLPNGINVERFAPNANARKKLEEDYQLNATDFIVGVVARNDPMKAYGSFLEAFATLHHKNPTLKAILVGEGTKKLPKQAGVTALGQRGDIESILSGFDVLCMPSSHGEGFPNVVVEAMACGTPCVVTDVGDALDIIGDTGIGIAPEFTSDIVYGLEKAASLNKKTLDKMGRDARRRIVENWALPKIIDSYNQIYLNRN